MREPGWYDIQGDNIRLWIPDGEKKWRAFLEAGYQRSRAHLQLKIHLSATVTQCIKKKKKNQLQGEGRLILVFSFKRLSSHSLAPPLWVEHHHGQNMADQCCSPMESGNAPPHNVLKSVLNTEFWVADEDLVYSIPPLVSEGLRLGACRRHSLL